jgi:hypothetical protein
MLTVNLAMVSTRHTSMDSSHLMVNIKLDLRIQDRCNDHRTAGKGIFPFLLDRCKHFSHRTSSAPVDMC